MPKMQPIGINSTTAESAESQVEVMPISWLKLIDKYGLPLFLTVVLLWNQFSLQNWFIAELSRRNESEKEQTKILNEIRDELRRK
jgi:hypothetical protein